jgi:hypothetical protein
MFRSLIVHHVQFWFEPFSSEFLEITFVCIVDTRVIQACNGGSKNGICFVNVHDEVAYAPVKQKRKGNYQSNCYRPHPNGGWQMCRSKNIRDGFVAVVIDDVWRRSGPGILLGQVRLAQRHPYWGWHIRDLQQRQHRWWRQVGLPVAASRFLVACSDPVPRLLHMAFCRCWAWAEVPENQFLRKIGASFEEPFANCFE